MLLPLLLNLGFAGSEAAPSIPPGPKLTAAVVELCALTATVAPACVLSASVVQPVVLTATVAE